MAGLASSRAAEGRQERWSFVKHYRSCQKLKAVLAGEAQPAAQKPARRKSSSALGPLFEAMGPEKEP